MSWPIAPYHRAIRPAVTPGRAIVGLTTAAVVLFFLAPLAALLWRAAPAAGQWRQPFVLDALRLSLITTALTAALAVAAGTPVAYLLARYRFPGRDALDTLLDLPMVLPPAVAGLALLMAFGRRGTFGPALAALGISLPFTTAAVVLAQAFVAAPFYIRAAKAGFAGVDRRLEQASATLGVSAWGTFWRVTAPLAAPALLGGQLGQGGGDRRLPRPSLAGDEQQPPIEEVDGHGRRPVRGR